MGSIINTEIDLGNGAPVPVTIYRDVVLRPAPLVLHLRGSGFADLPAQGDSTVARLLAAAGAVVISAGYPTGVANPFPAALERLHRLLQHVYDNRAHWAARGSKLWVAGEEAGGNLAAALTLMARDRLGPPIAGQILLSPMLDAGMATCSFRDAEAGPVGCKFADGWRLYLGSPEKASHPYAAPASGSRLAGLPPALVLTTQTDPMRDESLRYARRLQDAGVAVLARTLSASGWPDALSASTGGFDREPPEWAADVGATFAEFFAAVTPPRVAARS